MLDINPDVKTGEVSSTSPVGDVSPSDASGTPSTPNPSTPAQPKGLADVLKETMDKHLASEAKKEEAVETQLKEEETKVEDPKAEEAKDPDKVEEKKPEDEKGPIPYERFREINEEKVKFQKQIEAQEGFVKAQQSIQDFCSRHEVAPEEFNGWFQTLALIKSDPEKAIEVLKPLMQNLESSTGNLLPKDLQEKVDSGELPLEFAQRIAKAEGRAKLSQRQQQNFVQKTQAQREQELSASFQNAINSWETSKKATDPSFKPKAGLNAQDGKYELFLAKWQAELSSLSAPSAEALVAAADRAYSSIDSFIQRQNPKPPTPSSPRTSQSTSQVAKPPKTLQEAIAQRAKLHGIDMPVKK